MSAEFVIPDWMGSAEPPPQPDEADVDPHRVEALVNRFIAGKQEALFTAPDAYYRTTGGDAVDGAPDLLDRLDALRNATLEAAGDDGTRFVLGPRLDAHLDDVRDGVDRHVSRHQDTLARQIISERQALLQRAAELEHTDDGKLAGLAEASASAAQELARMNGEPEGPAVDAARSAIWKTAIDQRLANGNGPQALTLFDQVKDRLAPADRLALDMPLQVARADRTADQWIASQSATDGPPLPDRVDADPNLPANTRFIVLAKLDARDSAAESKRTAAVKGLDDQVADTMRALAGVPGTYRPGTLAKLAAAYDDADEPDKAAATRRLAAQEAALVLFAHASVDRQQRQIDSLPAGEFRDTAAALQRQQAEAFARDAFAAGTALYPEVGPPAPIDDIAGRTRQARQIAWLRGAPVAPFTADELARMRQRLVNGSATEQQAIRTQFAALPDDMKAAVTPQLATQAKPREMASDIPEEDEALHRPGAEIAQSEPSPPAKAIDGRALIDVERWINAWLSDFRPGEPIPEMPKGLAERLSPGQKAEIDDILSHGADTRTDPKVLETIQRGLRSSDLAERLKWAREPLYRYRGSLSPDDFRNLAGEQANINPDTGAKGEGIGHPIGTLEDHADLAISLSGGKAIRWVYNAGRWLLEKIARTGERPAREENLPAPPPNEAAPVPAPAEAVGKKIAESALSTRDNGSATEQESAPRVPGFSDIESKMIADGERIHDSPEFTAIRAAHDEGRTLEVKIGGINVLYEPHNGIPYEGMSLDGGRGFVLFPPAFRSADATWYTIMHELHRGTSGKLGYAEAGSYARDADRDARDFAERAVKHILRKRKNE